MFVNFLFMTTSVKGRVGELSDIILKRQFLRIYLFIYLFLLFGGVTPGDAQGLPLALHSGITPGGAQGTIWDAGNQTWANALPAVLLLQPQVSENLNWVIFNLMI